MVPAEHKYDVHTFRENVRGLRNQKHPAVVFVEEEALVEEGDEGGGPPHEHVLQVYYVEGYFEDVEGVGVVEGRKLRHYEALEKQEEKEF